MKLIPLLSSLAVPLLVTCSPLIDNGVRQVKRSPLMTGMANGGGVSGTSNPAPRPKDSYSYWFGLGEQNSSGSVCNVKGQQNYNCLQPTGGSWNWIQEFQCAGTHDFVCKVPNLAEAQKVRPLCEKCGGAWTDVAVTR